MKFSFRNQWALACVGMMHLACAAGGQPLPETAYLFSYFIDNGEDGLHLAWSADGYAFTALNGGQSYLTPAVGENRLMRDP